MDPNDLLFRIVTTLIPMILAIGVHEYAHVAMAYWLGDDTGARMGRLTLNPIAHVDPVGTLLLPILWIISTSAGANIPYFGWGKAAPYNPMRLTRKFGGQRINMRTAEMLVAFAGPLSNVILALITFVVVVVMFKSGMDTESYNSPVYLAIRFLLLNVALAIFNMIPLSPLDGSKVLVAFLPSNLANWFFKTANAQNILLFVVVFFGLGSYVIAPVQQAVLTGLFALLR